MYRQRIIENATNLFIVQGVKASTMDDIAKDMGISKRTIYEHFKDKRELIEAIIEYLEACKKNTYEEIFTTSDNVLHGFLETLQSNKCLSLNSRFGKIMMEFRRFYPDIIISHFSKFNKEEGREKLQNLIIKGIDEGVFRKNTNPKSAAYLFSEQVMLIFKELSDKIEIYAENDKESKHFIQDLVFNFLRGISTPKGVEIIDKYTENMSKNYGDDV